LIGPIFSSFNTKLTDNPEQAPSEMISPMVAILNTALLNPAAGSSGSWVSPLIGIYNGIWETLPGAPLATQLYSPFWSSRNTASAAAVALALTDTDRDGLSDADEIQRGTDPRNPDTDHDGAVDGLEVILGTDPLNAADTPFGTGYPGIGEMYSPFFGTQNGQ
jgi:hypothetical protein